MEPTETTVTKNFNSSRAVREWMAHGRELKERLKRQANVHEEEIANATSARDAALAAASFIDSQLEMAQKDLDRMIETEEQGT